MTVVVALDAGTTGVRAIAFDRSGRVVGSSYREFPQYFPAPGRVEHDADEIWQAMQSVMTDLSSLLLERDEDVAALGITNQRETVVAWSRSSGRPLQRALVWQDRRTADRCEDLDAAGLLPLIRSTTGLVLDPYFSATKLQWLLTEGGVDDSPETALGTIDSWLLWNLTGGRVHATEPSNASRTMLFDLHTGAWSDELTGIFGVGTHLLPEILPSSGVFGVTSADCPLGGGIPITGVAGDQQASLFGQCCHEPGAAKNTYGTGSFVLMNVGPVCPEPADGLLTTVAWTLPGPGGPNTTYAYEGAIFVTGAAVQWLRDGLGLITESAEVTELAASVHDSGGVVVVPAFTGLGSPWWDPHARGAVFGLTRGSGRAHLARATLEAMAFQTRDVVDRMSASCGLRLQSLRVDGGAATDLVLRLQADQLDVPVLRPAVTDTTALGAAFLAGLAVGFWESIDELATTWQLDARFDPGEDRAGPDADHRRWRNAVDRVCTGGEPPE